MSNKATTVSTIFKGAGAAEPAGVSLVLEQEPFPAGAGEVKTMHEIAEENGLSFFSIEDGGTAYSSDIRRIADLYYAQCGIVAVDINDVRAVPRVSATIYVFKTPVDLPYKLVANAGTFEEDQITGSTIKEESITFKLSRTVNLRHRVESIESIEWEGEVYDAAGGVVYPDVPYLSGVQLVTNQLVYGVCRIKYKVFGDVWTLIVPVKEDAEENEYQCTVFAFYGDNQVEELQVTFPNLSGLCNESVSIRWADDEQPADDEPVDDGSGTADGSSVALQLQAFDYCHGGAVSGATFWIGGTQVPATGHTVKRGMIYTITVKASGYKDFTNSFSV